jgi:diacylglycerol O-acyltransferase
MTAVDPISRIFLHLETRSQPMHVGGLQLFALPEGAPAEFVSRLVRQAQENNQAQAPFDQKLRYCFGQPCWGFDHDFDIQHHVKHHVLPAPGGDHELFTLVAELHGIMLDRTRPLWEFHVIEGLAGRRFATYAKFHHALMDGVSAMRVTQQFLAPEAMATAPYFPWQLQPYISPRAHVPAGRRILTSVRDQISALPATACTLREALRGSASDPDFTGPTHTPRSMLNVPISGARQYCAQSYSLNHIRALATKLEATINDVVLAMCSAALRRYLIARNALPKDPLIAMVPVSLHDADQTAGNRLGLLYANLATHMDDPAERLRAIKRSVDYWKRRYMHMTPTQIMAFVATLSMPTAAPMLAGVVPRRQPFNIVISNIPGPDATLYLGNAQLLNLYPVSIVLGGQALNICLASYADKLEFGLTACRYALPDMPTLISYLTEGLEELATVPHSRV